MAIAASEDLERLVRREHGNPHGILGAHPTKGGVVVRAFRPAAASVKAVTADGETAELEQVHPGGIFEGVVDGAELAAELQARGRLRRRRNDHDRRPVSLPAHRRRARPAPRRRGPPRGAVDQARRARRRRSTACAGPRSPSGRRRAARCRWSATSTSGTAACTRCARSARRASGSSSCPASRPAPHYKYEILAPDGEIRLKADPVAFATEVPPKTASVVHESTHEWADEEWLADRAGSRSRSRARCRSTRSTSARGG